MSVTMKKNIILINLIVLGIVLISLVKLASNHPVTDTGKIKVVTSFYPLYFFTSKIAGDLIQVSSLIPSGVEPHEFEPNTSEIAQLENSKLFIYIGSGFEPWADSLPQSLKDKNVSFLSVTDNLSSVLIKDATDHTVDPHVWLDPVLAQQIVKAISEELQKIDPTNAQTYQQNSAKLIENLSLLDSDFKQGLAKCKHRSVVTSHSAFGYLMARYRLEQLSIAGFSPEQEPAVGQLAELSNLVKKSHINYIFFETLVSPRLAETLANEVGAKTLVLDPLEGLSDESVKKGYDYLSLQRQNLNNLRLALECE